MTGWNDCRPRRPAGRLEVGRPRAGTGRSPAGPCRRARRVRTDRQRCSMPDTGVTATYAARSGSSTPTATPPAGARRDRELRAPKPARPLPRWVRSICDDDAPETVANACAVTEPGTRAAGRVGARLPPQGGIALGSPSVREVRRASFVIGGDTVRFSAAGRGRGRRSSYSVDHPARPAGRRCPASTVTVPPAAMSPTSATWTRGTPWPDGQRQHARRLGQRRRGLPVAPASVARRPRRQAPPGSLPGAALLLNRHVSPPETVPASDRRP